MNHYNYFLVNGDNIFSVLLYDAIEGQMKEVKGVGRRRTHLLDYLKKILELEEEAEA